MTGCNTLLLACILIFSVFQSSVLTAADLPERRAEADYRYQQNDFKKAFKAYMALAKEGDHYSQERISKMYASGEGKSANLADAYAWSVLAAESGDEQMMKDSALLWQRIGDQAKAQKSADKLLKRYGREALEEKAAKQANRDPSRCIGSLLACKRR